MNMKLKAMLLGLSIMTALPVCAQKPVYLDTNKPIEERVKDALNRMTLEEKVKMDKRFLYCLSRTHLSCRDVESRNVLPLWKKYR